MNTCNLSTGWRAVRVISASFCAVLMALRALAATWTDESGNVWTYNGSTITAVTIETTALAIPSTLGGNAVTGFNKEVFAGKNVVRVTIPSSVTAIPDNAFLDCARLSIVTVQGQGLGSIGNYAFKGCKNLQSFVIPDSVTSLGRGAFSGCESLSSITIGDGVKTLPGVDFTTYSASTTVYSDNSANTSLYGPYDNGLFYNCTSLETINWGANVREIGNIAFLNCSSLEEVAIPNSVTNIGHHAFLGCDALESVAIGDGVMAIGRMAFRALPNLQTVEFGSNVDHIGRQAFQDCVQLKNFTLPESIWQIDYRAFAGCSRALTSVSIPANIYGSETELGQGVFSGCSKLATVTFGDTVKTLPGVDFTTYSASTTVYSDNSANTSLYGPYDNGLFYNCTSLKTINWGAGIKTIGNIAFLNCSALENVTIPDTVTTIGRHAFFGCENLTTVTIGNKVTEIGRMAFRALSKLTNVGFGQNVEHIGQQAFQDCVQLKNFTLPESIWQIDYRAFAGCSAALTSVTIPANIYGSETELGQGVFSGCSKLATVTFGDTVKTLTGVDFTTYSSSTTVYSDNSANTSLYGPYADGLFYNCTSLKTINWGANVKTIGNVAFLNCSALESVTIPDTVTSIGCHAFLGCENLATVTIGKKVTEIGRMAFRALPSLTHVTFGAKVKQIGQQAFQDCANLQNFMLPETIQNLDYRAFAGCSKALTAVTIPANINGADTELGQGVFSGCSKLATVTFGDTVKTLTGVDFTTYSSSTTVYSDNSANTSLYGPYDNGLFYNCTSLKTINWGSGIKTVGNVAFLNCSALASVTIPANVSEIGCHAFYGCTSLRTATVQGSISFLGRRAFANCPALRYVDFQGAVMTDDPGEGIFDFDGDGVTVYAAAGSTGWKGVADVGGLPADRKWCDASIAYGPSPANQIPVFSSATPKDEAVTMQIGESQQFSVTARDPDGDDVTVAYWYQYNGGEWTFFGYDSDLVLTPQSVDDVYRIAAGVTDGISTAWNYRYWDVDVKQGDVDDYGAVDGFVWTRKGAVMTVGGFGPMPDGFMDDPGLLANADGVKVIVVNEFVTKLKAGMWRDFPRLMTVVLPNTLEYIYFDFAAAPKLEMLYLPQGFVGALNQLGLPDACSVANTDVYYFVKRLYNLCYDREHEWSGCASWSKKLTEGAINGATTAFSFFTNAEMTRRNLSNADFVEVLYLALMDHRSDSKGKAYWVGLLDSGVSRKGVVRGFTVSKEFTGICETFNIVRGDVDRGKLEQRDLNYGVTKYVARCYTKALGRKYEVSGLNSWCGKINSSSTKKATAIQVARSFLNSNEFKNKRLSNSAYVDVLYQTFFGRNPDTNGKKKWLGQLNSGVSRDKVMASFYNSKEFSNIMAECGIK